jgi:DNA repair ATPase RecN
MSGLKYQKLDLHTHTPASKCYLHKDQTADQIIESALAQGLKAIAITDHNTAEWIDKMKEAAESTELVIFPGVELSLEQGHIVALFDPDFSRKDVEGLLGGLDIKPNEFGKSETVCAKTVYEVVGKIHERGGLAVLAHIDQPKGIFYDMSKIKEKGKVNVPVSLSKILNEAEYDAVECKDGKLPEGFDADHQIKRFPPFYQASDNPDPEKPTRHSLAGIGSQYTWFKLDTMDLEGLRQCFSDCEVRILLKDDFKKVGVPHILSMKVGEKGFLRNQRFDFHPGLNSVIGGKGVGKSLAIEILRFGLGQPASDRSIFDDHVGKLEARLEPDNTVELVYQTDDGTQYQIIRTYNGKEKVDGGYALKDDVKCVNLNTGEEFKGDIRMICPVLAYSQMEVLKIAEDKAAQLKLIDRFIDTRTQERLIQELREKLHDNDQEFDRAIQARSQLESYEHDIKTLDEQIKRLNRSLSDPLFDKMKGAEAKKDALEEQQEFTQALADLIRQWQTQLLGISAPDPAVDDADVKGQNTVSNKIRSEISDALSKFVTDIRAAREKVDAPVVAWQVEYQKIEADFKNLLAEMGGDKETLDKQRKKLESEKSKLDKSAKEARNLIANLDKLIDKRNKQLDELERAYRAYFEGRKTKFDELTTLSDDKLKLDLVHAENRESYESLVMDLLKGGANAVTPSDRRKIANGVLPRRLVDLVLNRNAVQLTNEAGITEGIANKAIEKFWSADNFSEVLALQHNCYPEDVPSIRYRKEEGVYAELNELSMGQKCSALLIVALCDGTMPVIIDQPEDALDNVSVWEDISKKLRRGKNNRQFILTTHNPTVSVGSDSDQYIVLEATANQGKIRNVGAIDQKTVREEIIHHLEGGNEPYMLRSRKYNIKDSN